MKSEQTEWSEVNWCQQIFPSSSLPHHISWEWWAQHWMCSDRGKRRHRFWLTLSSWKFKAAALSGQLPAFPALTMVWKSLSEAVGTFFWVLRGHSQWQPERHLVKGLLSPWAFQPTDSSLLEAIPPSERGENSDPVTSYLGIQKMANDRRKGCGDPQGPIQNADISFIFIIEGTFCLVSFFLPRFLKNK